MVLLAAIMEARLLDGLEDIGAWSESVAGRPLNADEQNDLRRRLSLLIGRSTAAGLVHGRSTHPSGQ